jgi:hypothetical protein
MRRRVSGATDGLTEVEMYTAVNYASNGIVAFVDPEDANTLNTSYTNATFVNTSNGAELIASAGFDIATEVGTGTIDSFYVGIRSYASHENKLSHSLIKVYNSEIDNVEMTPANEWLSNGSPVTFYSGSSIDLLGFSSANLKAEDVTIIVNFAPADAGGIYTGYVDCIWLRIVYH